ncbi:hypothetical protein B0A48_14387 [Cryoendolithus antarcticus]|uniref:Peptidase A1 domain-containing protein n=1 Tax=Cryoendolithus antarcticus TaxID=1507870 RepID=A0A1V8SKE0_9PEZI|nr:hypothetical protein B0A48_14387 [Cryoendolithus antarcticus]
MVFRNGLRCALVVLAIVSQAMQALAGNIRYGTRPSTLGYAWAPRALGPSAGLFPTGGIGHIANDTYPQASRCNAAKISYSEAKRDWETPGKVMLTTNCPQTTSTVIWTLMDTEAEFAWTTYCDGHPRTPPGFTYPITSGTTIETLSICAQNQTNTRGSYPSASPSCSIAESDCEKLLQTNVYQNTEVGLLTTTPMCSTSSGFFGACGECTIFANDVQLQEFPVSTTNGDSCTGGGSIVTATPTGVGPNTQVVGGQTYISPSVYMSFGNLFATGATNQGLCGIVVNGFVASMWDLNLQSLSYSVDPAQPSYVQTFTSPLNLADLKYPVPWSVYKGMDFCTNSTRCETISQPYLPQLILPSWLSALQPAWATCVVHSTGVLDPPLGLTAAATMMGPSMGRHTATAAVISATAAQAASLIAPIVSQTLMAAPSSAAGGSEETKTAQAGAFSSAWVSTAPTPSSQLAVSNQGPASDALTPGRGVGSAAGPLPSLGDPGLSAPNDVPHNSAPETESESYLPMPPNTFLPVGATGHSATKGVQSTLDSAQISGILASMIAVVASVVDLVPGSMPDGGSSVTAFESHPPAETKTLPPAGAVGLSSAEGAQSTLDRAQVSEVVASMIAVVVSLERSDPTAAPNSNSGLVSTASVLESSFVPPSSAASRGPQEISLE